MTTICLPSREPDAPVLSGHLPVRPWPDQVIDALGHDPRSPYVETFWLGILGPSTTWLLRRLAAGLEASPEGFDLDLAEAAAAIGIGGRGGRHGPFMRALGRCCRFGVAEVRDESTLAVRRKIPPLTRRQVVRLPSTLRLAHDEWQAVALSADGELRRRCRRLALSLVELGEDPESTEHQLTRWDFPPALAAEATAWAIERNGATAPGDG